MDKKQIEEKTVGVEDTIPVVRNYVVLVPIFFKGQRKEVGETIELTTEEYEQMTKLVTEIKE